MTDTNQPHTHRFTQKELEKIFSDNSVAGAAGRSWEAHVALMQAAKMEILTDEVSGLREDMGKMQETFARIASALERSNDIRERELGPVKDRAKIKGLGKS